MNPTELKRVPHLVRTLHKAQNIRVPDQDELSAVAWQYPFADNIEHAVIMDQITCPKCGGKCEYYGGTATCTNLHCGAQYPW